MSKATYSIHICRTETSTTTIHVDANDQDQAIIIATNMAKNNELVFQQKNQYAYKVTRISEVKHGKK